MFSKSAHKKERKYSGSSEDRLSDSDKDHYFQNKRSKHVPSSSESDRSDIDNSRNAKNHAIPNKKKTGHSINEDRRSCSTSYDKERKKSKWHGHHDGSKNHRAYHHQSGNVDYKRHENHEEKHQHRYEQAGHSENEKYSHKFEYHRKSNERDSRSPIRTKRDNHHYKHRKFERSRSRSFDHASAKWGKDDTNEEKPKKVEKEKPNFAFSGKLTEETNTYRGVVIKYSEPPEARKPKRRWRLYPFKGEKALQTLYIHRESGYLIGRDRKVVDIPVDHPSCSKQHAALQYRLVTFTREDGTAGKRVRPYLIDLDSANGTYINNKRIEPRKYVELLEKDVIKFGYSSREYVLLHENSKDETQDDDVKEEVIIKEEQ